MLFGMETQLSSVVTRTHSQLGIQPTLCLPPCNLFSIMMTP